jgi:Ca2+-binding EF-hand superfamily protein
MEEQYFAQLYALADQDKDGKLNGNEAAAFLRTSGISVADLAKIWDLSDQNRFGYLTPREFTIALKLIALAQSGREISLQNIPTVTNLPKFNNIPLPVIFGNITEEDLDKYDTLFIQADQNKDGFVDGTEAKNYLTKSQLPQESLAKIWQLSEVDGDGKLSKGEFRMTMHLVYWVLKGNPLPTSLPPNFVAQCMSQNLPKSQPQPTPNSAFPQPSSQGGLTFVPTQSAQRHDETRLVNQYALPGASFETRTNLTHELSEKIDQRNRSKSKSNN